MSEDSGEQQPHKFSRVPDVKTARQNLAKRRDEKQIGLIQEALRRESLNIAETPVGQATAEKVPEVEHDPVKFKSELFRALAKAVKLAPKTYHLFSRNSAEQIRAINEIMGPLLYMEVPLESLKIPRVLKDLENSPDYDQESIRTLREGPRSYFREGYNRSTNILQNVAPTLGDLLRLPNQEIKDRYNSVSAHEINAFKQAFRPNPAK